MEPSPTNQRYSMIGLHFHNKLSILETQVSASSTHSILEGTPELDIIELFISPTRSIDDAIAEFRIDNLELGGRFLQISGAGVIQLDSNNCSWNGSVATWSVTGQWMLDDYARLNWLVQTRNMAYETLGPAHGVSGSEYVCCIDQ